MNRKTLLSFIVVFLVSILFSTVGAVLVDVQPVDDHVSYDEVAKYTLDVINNKNTSVRVEIPTPRNDWDITIRPYFFELEPHQSRKVNLSIAPPRDVDSQDYSVQLYFNLDGVRKAKYRWVNVYVTEKSPVIEGKVMLSEEKEITEVINEGFMGKQHEITIKNVGQVAVSGEWSRQVSLEQDLFSSFDVEPDSVKSVDSGKEYVWSYSLEPGQSKVVSYSVSYVSLLIASILLAIAVCLLAIYYRSSFRLLKNVVVSRKKGDSAIKIKIHIKNKTSRTWKNVVIEDYLPVPLKLRKKFGTLSPSAVKKNKDKTILVWKFDEFEPKEERVVSYEMKSSLEVIGKITIPPACIKLKKVKGKGKNKIKKTVKLLSKVKEADRL